jgi:PilZ domain
MTTTPVSLERRAGQRFDVQIPVTLKLVGTSHEACGFTQDLSARGTFFYTDFPLAVGERVELTLLMPAEITLTESMRVCCQGTVLRVVPPSHGTKIGVAVHFAGYEYISESRSDSPTFNRISALHEKTPKDEPPAGQLAGRRSAIT